MRTLMFCPLLPPKYFPFWEKSVPDSEIRTKSNYLLWIHHVYLKLGSHSSYPLKETQMKKTLVKLLILGALLASANVSFPREVAAFDGPGPTPQCSPVTCMPPVHL